LGTCGILKIVVFMEKFIITLRRFRTIAKADH